ncbi:hypothetical protein [Arthrobacter sp. H14-L1]|uniref:hypothetical protein n=1 Tax=Arthrobacter sp. H14-L1 TaxID=2996697 RepID=UPI00226E1EC1|nr:hypothetical protein [Arthrobacter sp. H14-L1]MCY0904572.1 hypothetical protein [Arthrobacter sp. H14-L1]
MELTSRLLALGVPHPFVITAPGFTAVRLAVEQQIRERGWQEALSPADADMLVQCGNGRTEFNDAIDRVWHQLPAPRTRMLITVPEGAASSLDSAAAALRDVEGLRRAEANRLDAPAAHGETNAAAKDDAAKDDTSEADTTDHADMDSATPGTGMGDMGDMDMDMELPGGLPMADRGADRDGLKLDQLHLVLGPALPDWPTGLVVRLVLQGDIAQSAEISMLDADPGYRPHSCFWAAALGVAERSEQSEEPRRYKLARAAASADSLQRFLNVAGWPSAARTGRWLRDELLDAARRNSPSTGTAALKRALVPRYRRWLRTVRRSQVLRWSTAGLGLLELEQLNPGQLDDRVSSGLTGDVTARVLRWLDDVAIVLDPAFRPGPESGPASRTADNRAATARAALAALPDMLAGQELASVRLIVASLDPDIEALFAAKSAPRRPHD